MASHSLKALVAVFSLVGEALAASTNETVWSSFSYVLYGDRTPLQSQLTPSLTPLGAQQLYSQGALFRARYLSPNANLSVEDSAITSSSPISGMELQALDNSQLSIYSTTDDYVVGGALAFLQGLYPPITRTFASSSGGENASTLANGTLIDYPLDGYQYPNVLTISVTDMSSVRLEGHAACAEYWASSNDFRSSSLGQESYNSTLNFYQTTFAQVFPGAISSSMLNFDYAYDLYDYAQYQYNHNSTAQKTLKADRLAILRNLANNQQFDLNGNLSASGSQDGDMIRAISGRMLAARAVAQLSSHIHSGGRTNKMSLLFGSFEPMLAFFALSNLSSITTTTLFSQIPQPGSVMTFELFSTTDDASYPNQADLWVRFLYRNGTANDAPMAEYPLFGLGNSETRVRWAEFEESVARFSIQDISQWCDICGSVTLFCSALGSNSGTSSGSLSSSSGGNSNTSLSPAVAGVIGALTTIAVFLAGGLVAFVFGGLRIRRGDAADAERRRSSLGGFKGAEKMASDHDVSIARTGARHERVGSWELGGPGSVTVPPAAATAEDVPRGFFGASVKREEDEESILGAKPVHPVERV
ncbi:phosphoglycerate mutase-like protein [Annulohypoxylon maeteangense]|uniref:phosphoglycerate mutase-like protein n=1 Tax=Annulohypoxylon maeteangense TaxID=1927788 RepID=UPI002008B32C|nr:phosphoglycerate mutase-like protein [Annulohypoxylon maeteangense]KAI0885104.1 phosphoglycerate mutase-like protein [Annulohypoxylon maeteangense]